MKREKLKNIEPVHNFLNNPVIPTCKSDGIKVDVELKDRITKKNELYDALIIAASGMFMCIVFHYTFFYKNLIYKNVEAEISTFY